MFPLKNLARKGLCWSKKAYPSIRAQYWPKEVVESGKPLRMISILLKKMLWYLLTIYLVLEISARNRMLKRNIVKKSVNEDIKSILFWFKNKTHNSDIQYSWWLWDTLCF